MKNWTHKCLLVSQIAKSFGCTKKGSTNLRFWRDDLNMKPWVLTECKRGTEGAQGPTSPCSWQHPKMSTVTWWTRTHFFTLPLAIGSWEYIFVWHTQKQQHPRVGQEQTQLHHKHLNLFIHHSPSRGACPLHLLVLKNQSSNRCTNRTQLQCCTQANNEARFMTEEAPDLFFLTGIKGQPHTQFFAGQNQRLPCLE